MYRPGGVLIVLVMVGAALAQEERRDATEQASADTGVEVVGHVLRPAQLEPTAERLDQLRLPAGFEIEIFADELVNPRMIAVAENGDVYVTRRSIGDVLLLRDKDGDGRAEHQETVARRPDMHGIAIDGDTVYLATVTEVFRTQRQPDGSLAPLEVLIDDLPDGGQHPNRTLAIGPKGKLYISVGSTCNACGETNPESATLLRAEPDGSARSIFASGLRNTIGFAFHPESGELYGMDHGIDWLGDNTQHEELNHLQEGKKYGWPYVFENGNINPKLEPSGGVTSKEWAEQSSEPIGLYTPHAAPMQMTFYTGDKYPREYREDAFIAMRGSWNRQPPSGYEVVRIQFEDGKPVAFEPFVQGFLMQTEDGEWGHLGRLAGLAQTPDGALLLADDTSGVMYRITYTGESGSDGEPPGQPTNSEGAQIRMNAKAEGRDAGRQEPGELALKVAAAEKALPVSSSAFDDGQEIPATYAAEQQNISPPLTWEAGPEGTASYVLLMEDPDVADEPPFVHWVLFNLPPGTTALPEGVPPSPQLPELGGAKQGTNDRGSVGYFGMKPPKGDPAHHYHFQVFALDQMLDLPHGASRAEVLKALEGKVLAGGTVTGTFRREK